MNPSEIGDPPVERTEEWHWPSEWQWPSDFRKFMGWIFLATSLQYFTITVRSFPYSIHKQYAVPLLRILLTAPSISIVMATISGLAWWSIWKGKPSAKGWGIAASLMYLLIFFRRFIIPLVATWDHRASALFIGTAGLVAFLWRDKRIDA